MAEQLPPAASPGLADGLAAPVTELHVGWETTTLRFMAGRLADGITRDDWATRRQVDLAAVRRELDRTLQRLAEVAGPAAVQAVTRAYERGHGGAGQPSRLAQITARVLDALRAVWAAMRGGALRLWNRAVAVGGRHADPRQRQAAVQRELDRAAARGITVFRDARGRARTVGPYVEETVQTAAGNAAMDGYLDRLTGAGDDLVRVTESPHPCPICAPWENRVLSISGLSQRYASVAEARAAGLWHPRCRHTIERYVPDQPKHPHAIRHLPGTYAQEQRQRAIERHIREWKRREAAALDDVARAHARRKVHQWEAALRQHLAATGLRRSRQRERVDFGHSRPLRHALGE